MRARIVVAAMLFVLCPLLASAQQSFRVTSMAGANVRAMPSTSAPILITLPKDSKVPFLERSGQWVKVEVIDRRGAKTTGFISGTLGLVERDFDVAAPSPPNTVAQPTPSPRAEAPAPAPPSTRTSATPSPITSATDNTAEAPAGAKQEWEDQFDLATREHKQSFRGMLLGAGGVALGVVLVKAGGEGDVNTFSPPNTGLIFVGTLTALGAGGLAAYELVSWLRAKGQVEKLESEGRAKGYVGIAPVPGGGVQFVAVLRF